MLRAEILQGWLAGGLTLVLTYAAVSDLRTRLIPNWTVVAVVALFVLWSVLAKGDGLAGHLAAGAIGLALGYGLFAAGLVGGGDGKLFAATALFVGFRNFLPLAVATSLIGGLLAVGFLLARPRRTWASLQLTGRLGADVEIPYGVAIAAAGVLVVWAALLGRLPPLPGF
ncbi:MAG: peptidase [Phenylobacterium sp.]|uniref:A24 family peptidase n=1 Tax=Phenylobacterium sp. TaxID=1871053 RepID=UPI001218C5E3|nr:prepilin peptidase [Phenylobacterium sp.]TAJ72501.1 MAG: peptidase [Phenylobacterium sp.]